MNLGSHLNSIATYPKQVVAFDGDDTLWIDGTSEQEWERNFKHLAADRLPSRTMQHTFRTCLKQNGFTIEGVRDALLASGQDKGGDNLPGDWLAQVKALPELVSTLKIRPVRGLDEALGRFNEAGYTLWIITKGDVVRQAIKLARFGQSQRFSRIEIVPRKSTAAYKDILERAGVEPRRFLMIGDAFAQDILPVLRLGSRAVHVPAGRWTLLCPLEAMVPGKRIHVCRSLEEAAGVCLTSTQKVQKDSL